MKSGFGPKIWKMLRNGESVTDEVVLVADDLSYRCRIREGLAIAAVSLALSAGEVFDREAGCSIAEFVTT